MTKEDFQHSCNVLEAKINGAATKIDALDGDIDDFKADVEIGEIQMFIVKHSKYINIFPKIFLFISL